MIGRVLHDPEFWVLISVAIFVALVWKPASRTILTALLATALTMPAMAQAPAPATAAPAPAAAAPATAAPTVAAPAAVTVQGSEPTAGAGQVFIKRCQHGITLRFVERTYRRHVAV